MTLPIRKKVPISEGFISFLEWEAASDAPVLIFSHANGFNASTYKALLQPLSGAFRIIAPDMRGHGETTLPTDSRLLPGWQAYRDDLVRFIDALAVKPKILAGHSLGAAATLLAAAAKPGLADALVVAEPVMATDATAWKAWWGRLRGHSDQVVPLVALTLKRRDSFKSREDAVKNFAGRGAFKSWPEVMVRDYVETGLVPEGDGFRLACRPQWEAANFSFYPFHMDRLGSRISAPITILVGTVNSATTEPVLKAFMRRHGHVRLVPVEGASHFLPMEYPDLMRTEICRAAGVSV
jgi:pimeloyl-ACP methyl ester carboxylesterase